MAGIDTSKLTRSLDYSTLLSNSGRRNGNDNGIISSDTLAQWKNLHINGRALKAAMIAEERGYLRESEGPARQSVADRVLDKDAGTTTVADILESLGLKSSIVDESEAADAENKDTAADASDTAASAPGTVDVTA